MADATDTIRMRYYEFGGYRVDRLRRLLFDREGLALELPTKSFDTLIYFLEHPGVVIDRATLLAGIWPKTVVEQNSLSQAVAALRRALGADAILTVPRQGYQFVLEVRSVAEPADTAAGTILNANTSVGAYHPRRMRRVAAGIGVLAVGIATAAVIGLANDRRPAISPIGTIGTDTLPRTETMPTSSYSAYAHFVKAFEMRWSDTPEDLAVQIGELDEAIRIDPGFALAHAYRASARVSRARLAVQLGQLDPGQDIEMARQDANRALELDPRLGLAHGILAVTKVFSGDLESVHAELRTALRLSPDDRLVVGTSALFALLSGHREDARELFARYAQFDPRGFDSYFFYLAGDIEGAAKRAREVISEHPAEIYAHLNLAFWEVLLDNRETAERELRTVEALSERRAADPVVLASLAYAYGRIGLDSEARTVFAKLLTVVPDPEQLHPAHWVNAHLGIGDVDGALDWAIRASANPFPLVPGPQLEFMLNTLNEPVFERDEFVALRQPPEVIELRRMPSLLK